MSGGGRALGWRPRNSPKQGYQPSISSFTVGGSSVTGSSHSYNSGAGGGTATGTLVIPAGATAGSQAVTITFAPPPGQTQGRTHTQSTALIIN